MNWVRNLLAGLLDDFVMILLCWFMLAMGIAVLFILAVPSPHPTHPDPRPGVTASAPDTDDDDAAAFFLLLNPGNPASPLSPLNPASPLYVP